MISQQEVNILKQVYEHNRKKNLIRVERFYAVLYDEVNSSIEFAVLIKKGQELEFGQIPRPREYGGINALPDYLIASKKALSISGLEQFLEKNPTLAYMDFEDPPRSWLGVPLLVADQAIGAIVVEDGTNDDAYGVNEERLLATMAGQVAVALENARGYRRLRELNSKIAQTQEIVTQTAIAKDFVHRINNLAGTIPIWITLIDELLYPSDPRDERLKQYLRYIEKDVTQLIDRAAELNRPIKEEEIDFRLLLESIAEQVKIQYTNIDCSQNLAADLYKVKANYFQMSSIIWNLVTNALESMPNGGMLTIHAKNLVDPHRKSMIEIQIGDTGPGIPEDKMSEVFEPFHTTKGPGRGYGLWRSKSYLEEIGGTISLTSRINVGTNITLVIPAASEDINLGA